MSVVPGGMADRGFRIGRGAQADREGRIGRVVRSGAAGFTLIEVLTAMMVLSIVLVTIFQLFSGGLRAARRAGEVGTATFLARQKMEELLLSPAMAPGEMEGDLTEGYSWHAAVSKFPLGEPDPPPAWQRYFSMFDIRLEIRRGEGPPLIELNARHIAREVAP